MDWKRESGGAGRCLRERDRDRECGGSETQPVVFNVSFEITSIINHELNSKRTSRNRTLHA